MLLQGHVARKKRIHCSGPLMPPGGNIEDILKEHERQVQQAVRKARLEKSGTDKNCDVYTRLHHNGIYGRWSLKMFCSCFLVRQVRNLLQASFPTVLTAKCKVAPLLILVVYGHNRLRLRWYTELGSWALCILWDSLKVGAKFSACNLARVCFV